MRHGFMHISFTSVLVELLHSSKVTVLGGASQSGC
jgi:hypothetical protein